MHVVLLTIEVVKTQTQLAMMKWKLKKMMTIYIIISARLSFTPQNPVICLPNQRSLLIVSLPETCAVLLPYFFMPPDSRLDSRFQKSGYPTGKFYSCWICEWTLNFYTPQRDLYPKPALLSSRISSQISS